MIEKWWGGSTAMAGIACLGYDWAYSPLCTYVLRLEPWSVTGYGLTCLIVGLLLNLLQFSVGADPPQVRSHQ